MFIKSHLGSAAPETWFFLNRSTYWGSWTDCASQSVVCSMVQLWTCWKFIYLVCLFINSVENSPQIEAMLPIALWRIYAYHHWNGKLSASFHSLNRILVPREETVEKKGFVISFLPSIFTCLHLRLYVTQDCM